MDKSQQGAVRRRGRFFQIDASAWDHVCSLGLNPAIAYLALASGSDRDNAITRWSVHAVEQNTAMPRRVAQAALQHLINAKAITKLKDGTRPSYLFEPGPSHILKTNGAGWPRLPEPEWIWLPNSLVTGTVGERSPLARLRGCQSLDALRLFVALYGIQELADNGGIPWVFISQHYSREKITDRGRYAIWGFGKEMTYVRYAPILEKLFPSLSGGFTDANLEPFWQNWNLLRALGLIELVPHLVEGNTDDAAIIAPCPDDHHGGTDTEHEIGEAMREAAAALLTERFSFHLPNFHAVLPVESWFPNVEMVGVFRLRYRPHTSRTAAWAAKLHGQRDLIERMREIVNRGAP